MLPTSPSARRMLLLMRRGGSQPKLDIMVIARELARFRTDDAPVDSICDWWKVDACPCERPSLATVRAWKETVPPISRAAIVHDPKWTRHAALLAALLRVRHAVGRSFLPSDFGDAISWRGQASVDEGGPYRGRMLRL